jgi:hypothetical protein
MNRTSPIRARQPSRGQYVAAGGAYLFFCGAVVFTAGLLTLSGFVLPERALPATEAASGEATPIAKIQLDRNEKGLCRQLMFHNDSGRFDEGGFGPCHGLIPDELLVETVRVKRTEAIGKVFRFR